MLNGVALTDLYRHMEWADATVWKAVLASPIGKADKRLLGYFYHLHMVQFAFLRVWRGESRTTAFPEFSEAQALLNWGQTYYPDAFAHLGTLDDAALAQPMPVPWAAMVEERIGRKPNATTVGETALQVTLHTLYHRGQINARLRELDGNPPLVDFIVWIWLARPPAVWPHPQ